MPVEGLTLVGEQEEEIKIPDPKFVDRWAAIYVATLIKSGNEAAKSWADRFLDKQYIPEVAAKVKILLKKRGFKIKE